MSALFSSLNHSLSSYLHRATDEPVEPAATVPEDEEDERLETPPAGSPAPVRDASRDPRTPGHRSVTRFSPNSLSTSSATMSGVLSAHPHFSVFRKSASNQSLDEIAAGRGADGSPLAGEGAARSSFSMRDLVDDDDDQEVETLATPSNQSPDPRRASPRAGDKSGSSETSSFHLSLDSTEMQSLNFGDQSSLSLSPAASPQGAAPVSRTPTSASPAQTSSVRLVPDSPPTTRTPIPRSRSSSAQSTGKMRSSVGPVQRVQFSPISSCPSPLLSASTLPPPPPPPPTFAEPSPAPAPARRVSLTASDENWSPLADEARASTNGAGETLSRPGSGILKHPRTPGTGRSVRFTASIVERTPEGVDDGAQAQAEDSPSVAVGSRSVLRTGRADESHEQDEVPREDTSAAADDDASSPERTGEGDSSVLVASFLSKLQAAIPSPDVSLVTSPPAPPPAGLPLISVDPSTPGPAPALTLFDESNPFHGLNSALGASVLDRTDGSHVVGAAAASFSSAPGQSTVNASASLATISDSQTLSASASASGTFLLQGSLVGGGTHAGAPSFGGQSFADLSSLHPRTLLPSASPERLGALEEVSEAGEGDRGAASDMSAATAVGHATPRAPQGALAVPLASAPAVPSPLRFEAASAEPLRESDMSVASSDGGGTSERAGRMQELHETPASSASVRLIDVASPPSEPVNPPSPPRSSAPAPPATPSSPAAESTSAASTSTTTSSSFYRQFMAARARDGLSQSAREEWTRLERGEKASPKEGARAVAAADDEEEALEAEVALDPSRDEETGLADRTEASVYYSPQRAWQEEEEEDVEDARGEASTYVDVLTDDEALLAESSVIEHEEARATFLSPIVEVTEPESNANTPLEPLASSSRARARDPPPAQPSFAAALSSSLAAVPSSSMAPPTPATPARVASRRAPATPLSASKIPRPRNPITPSQNPFLLQLARTSSSATVQPQAVTLLQDLFSTQQDQLAASSSQRFILSSVVSNLQNEVEHKDAVIRSLKQQVGETRSELKELEQLALAWEERALRSKPSTDAAPPSARKTSAALEETVQLLADELETRVREDRALRDELEAELHRTRAELARRVHEVRDGEIRLRHAHAALEQADGEREAMKREVERGEDRHAEVVRERDELRGRWAVDVEERERTLARLRDEVRELRDAAATSGRGLDDEAVEREVQRRVEEAQADAHREAQLVKRELVQRDAALADLRDQLRAQRDETDRLSRAVQEERQHAELAHADMADVLANKERELEEVLHDHDALQQELDSAYSRLEAAELERDRLVDAADAKDDELAEQVSQCQTALAAMADLEAAVVRIEAEAAAKDAQLAQAQRELAAARRESADVLEKRDRVLAETEKAAGRTRKELEALQKETNRLTDLVSKLRHDSADREVKVTKLKKRVAELDEDVFGLNIALDAKQQEAAHWKRQMSSIKLEREAAAAVTTAETSTATRAAFAPHVPSSTVPSTAKARRRPSASTRLHSTTPFPAEKQVRRSSSSSLSRRSSTISIARRSSTVVDPAISTDDEEHDLTLPPTAYEQTPSRAATTTVPTAAAGLRKSASAAHLGLGLGMPLSARYRKTNAPEEQEKENAAAPAPTRRREAVLA